MLSQAQLEQREGRIGSSSVAAVLGLSPWQTPLEAWLQITGREKFAGNEQTQIGEELEAPIANLAKARGADGDWVKCNDSVLWDDWAVATPDFIEYGSLPPDAGILEIKNVGEQSVRLWEAGPPTYVKAQVFWQGKLTGSRKLFVAALLGGSECKVFPVKYDEGAADAMFKLAHKWWLEHVGAGKEPDIDPARDGDYLKRKWDKTSGEMREATETMAATVENLKQMKRRYRQLGDVIEAEENLIKAFIADADGITAPEGNITWRRSRDVTRTDYKAVVNEVMGKYPEIEPLLVEAMSKHSRVQQGSRRFVTPRHGL
jgi:putative phage-type endonuclease